MLHRGPDDAGIYLNLENQIGLGHRRLSIIDLSERGRQPMESSSGENVITYNGEVYGLVEIGGKCWFKENLRTTLYQSGTAIPNSPDEGDWFALGHSGGYCAYK